ncbi:MAG: phosphoribosyltransferase family protein, partial [Woeseiaceae bacterium]|nr:phosphoribosyltransferase family protein [Woeseiaceae bacterium]
RATPYQSGLDPAARRANLAQAFAIRGRLSFRHVLIVDDVITTGETCRQIAGLLKSHGVADVSVLAVARTVR